MLVRIFFCLALLTGLSSVSLAGDCVTQGDGINDKYDTDCDNDGTNDKYDTDLDNDGTNDKYDTDMDNDGVNDKYDTDMDNDGINDKYDNDMDNDGVNDKYDTDRFLAGSITNKKGASCALFVFSTADHFLFHW